MACLDKKRAEYEGVYGYYGEDEEGAKPKCTGEESPHSREARKRLDGCEVVLPEVMQVKKSWRSRIGRLLEGHGDVRGDNIIAVVDATLAGAAIRPGRAKSLQKCA
jgi:hypothetical protein